MDICMLTPSERGELQALCAEYERIQTRILTVLERISTEWKKEIETAYNPDEVLFTAAWDRMEYLLEWIELTHPEHVISLETMDDLYRQNNSQ